MQRLAANYPNPQNDGPENRQPSVSNTDGQVAPTDSPPGQNGQLSVPPEWLASMAASQQQLTQIVAQVLSPQQQQPKANAKPLVELVQDYKDWMAAAKGRGVTKHVRLTNDRLRELAAVAGWRLFTDVTVLTLASAMERIGQQRQGREGFQDLSPRTCHHYYQAARQFCRWVKKQKLTPINPLDDLEMPEVTDDDVRHDRRPLLWPSEFGLVYYAARSGPTKTAIPGPDRAAAYLIAAVTGYRKGELASLTKASFHFGGEKRGKLEIVLEAKFAKNRKAARQAVPFHSVAKLREWLDGKPEATILFPVSDQVKLCLGCRRVLKRKEGRCDRCAGSTFEMGVDRDTAEMVRFDAAACGIPYKDLFGRVVDFHSFRVGFASTLVDNDVALADAQKVMRHSDPKLTNNIYNKTNRAQAIVDKIPSPWSCESTPRVVQDSAPTDVGSTRGSTHGSTLRIFHGDGEEG